MTAPLPRADIERALRYAPDRPTVRDLATTCLALMDEKDPTGQWYAAIALVRTTQEERERAIDRAERAEARISRLEAALRDLDLALRDYQFGTNTPLLFQWMRDHIARALLSEPQDGEGGTP